MTSTTDKQVVHSKEISCKGDDISAHPMIYLRIAKGEASVTCPYCSKEYVYKSC